MSPPTGEIHVWFHDVDLAPVALGELALCLSSAELAKAARYRGEPDKRRSIVARASLRGHLSRYCGIDAAAILIRSEPGVKPEAPATGIHFNVSHAGDLVGMAFSSEYSVGFDIERVRPLRDRMLMAKRFFSADEQQAVAGAVDPDDMFFRVWTAKEAVVKGTGQGLPAGLGLFTVPHAAATLTPIRSEAVNFSGWQVASVTPPREGYRAAVAVQSSAVIRVVQCGGDASDRRR